MKFAKYITFATVALALTACYDKDVEETFIPNPDVDFTYTVDGDQYKYDFYVVSTIKFNNTSAASGNFEWDFGDGTTSTEVSPTHKYEKAGLYTVTLKHDTKGSKRYPILIYDIVPVLTVAEQTTEIVEFNNTLLSFNIELPNPENLPVRYEWTFPEGTTYDDGTPATTFTGYSDTEGNVTYPANVKFANIGSQRINIDTYFDTREGVGENRKLESAYLNVQVGTDVECPTLYYAVRGGNIKAYKLIENVPAGSKVMPFDMGVPAGNTVFNLLYDRVTTSAEDEDGNMITDTSDWIYILNAGKQYYYVNDEDGVLGDGQITAMRGDGTGVNTVITNVGGAAFLDPFIGCIYNGNIYYTDRNTGCTKIPETSRGLQEGKKSSTEREDYAFQNNVIPYYGRGLSYGAISNGLYRDKSGYWWWGKKYNGVGIFRFKDSDVYATQKEAESVKVPAEIVLASVFCSTFAIDEDRNALYIWRAKELGGFYALPLPKSATETITMDQISPSKKEYDAYIAMDADPVNTTESEGLYTTQLAVEKESGRVYFCFRPDKGDESGVKAGINYYDPTDKKIHKYGEDSDLGMGIVINPNKSKLF